MSIYTRLASAHGRRDEDLNKQLGRELAQSRESASISEIAKGFRLIP